MDFNQKEDGSCDIEFSKEELEIIAKHKKIFLSAEGLRHFGNDLVKIVADWNIHFSEDVKKIQSNEETIIKGQEPKDTND
jgi:hypothetical protein